MGTPLAELGTGAAWLLGLSAANQIVAILFRSNPLATAVIQAVIVDLAVGRAGVRWEPLPEEKPPSKSEAGSAVTTPAAPPDSASADEGAPSSEAPTSAPATSSRAPIASRTATTPVATATGASTTAPAPITGDRATSLRGIGIGAGIALAVTVSVLGLAVGLGWAKVSATHAPNLSLLFGLLRSVAIGVRDSLLYVALPLHFAARASQGSLPRGAGRSRLRVPPIPRGAVLAFSALAGGAVLVLQPAATPANVVLAMTVSGLAAVLWSRDGAGWAAVGLLAGWVFLAGNLIGGGILDVDWKKGALAPGFLADGAPAWVAAALFAATAAALLVIDARRARSPGQG